MKPKQGIFMTVDDLAEVLQVNRAYIYRLLKSRREGNPNSIPAYRLRTGKRSVWRFIPNEIIQWMKTQNVTG